MATVALIQKMYSLNDESTSGESYTIPDDACTAITTNSVGGGGGGSCGNDGSVIWRGHGNTTTTSGFTIATDAWAASGAIPASRQYCGYSGFDTCMIQAYGSSNDDFYRFTFAVGTWATEAVDTGQDNQLCTSFGFARRLHTMGGLLAPNTDQRVFDLADDTHVAGTSIGDNTRWAAGVSIASRGYLIGGYDGSSISLDNAVVWLPENDAWVNGAAITGGGRRLAHAVTDLAKIYFRSGLTYPSPGAGNLNHRYDPDTNAWATMSVMVNSMTAGVGTPSNGNMYSPIQVFSFSQIAYIDSESSPEDTAKIKLTYTLGYDYTMPWGG